MTCTEKNSDIYAQMSLFCLTTHTHTHTHHTATMDKTGVGVGVGVGVTAETYLTR